MNDFPLALLTIRNSRLRYGSLRIGPCTSLIFMPSPQKYALRHPRHPESSRHPVVIQKQHKPSKPSFSIASSNAIGDRRRGSAESRGHTACWERNSRTVSCSIPVYAACGKGSTLRIFLSRSKDSRSQNVLNNSTTIPPHAPRIAGGLAPLCSVVAATAHRIRQGQVRPGFDPSIDANSGGI